MKKTVGINGIAGRIGKFTAYELTQLGVDIVAVNDLATTDAIVESLSHRDGVHGSLDWEVNKVNDAEISVNGNSVKVFHAKHPSEINWDEWVYAICECAGPFTKRVDAEGHFSKAPNLEAVLVSAPGEGMKTYVVGINHAGYQPSDRVVSNASCTTKALAMPLKVLLDGGIRIKAVLMDTTHAVTNTQKPLDFMSTYGALDTISSAKTGAAIATAEVLPELNGIMDGFAMRVPTRDGSFANIYLIAEGENLSPKYINELFEKAAKDERYCGRLEVFCGKEIASPDIIGNGASAVIALSKTKSIQTSPNQALVCIVSGYDNERGPARDLALLTQHVVSYRKMA